MLPWRHPVAGSLYLEWRNTGMSTATGFVVYLGAPAQCLTVMLLPDRLAIIRVSLAEVCVHQVHVLVGYVPNVL